MIRVSCAVSANRQLGALGERASRKATDRRARRRLRYLRCGAEHPNPWVRGSPVTLAVLDERPALRAGLEEAYRRLRADPEAVARSVR